jgi:hypothetical protein
VSVGRTLPSASSGQALSDAFDLVFVVAVAFAVALVFAVVVAVDSVLAFAFYVDRGRPSSRFLARSGNLPNPEF